MDRSEAATTLFLWELEGERRLVDAASGNGETTLVSRVEAAARDWRVPRRARPPPPPIDFLRLDEEAARDALRRRLDALGPVLRADEASRFQAELAADLRPAGELTALRADLDRVSSRQTRRALQQDFEAHVERRDPRGAAAALRALLLFARDGRLVAAHGALGGFNPAALADVVGRGEAGSTWSLTHRDATVVGHIGTRAALIAVFDRRPRPGVGGTLRVSLASLEQRGRLMNALGQPASHNALIAYLRAVRLLLQRGT